MLRVLPMAKKWDSDATPSEKLLLLFVLLLFNNRPFSLSELSSTWLNASKATVLRLLGQLESAKIGVLKREKRGRESYYSLDHDRPPDFSLNREAIDQLSLCRDFILYLLPKKMQHDTAMTIGRLAALAGNGGLHEAGSVGGSLTKGRIDYSPFQEIFSTLENAVKNELVCNVAYLASRNSEPREYLFAPKRLTAYREDDDNLEASGYARALCEFIRHADTPVTIGIQGGWGSGKTSLITVLQEDLNDDPGHPALCVFVNAWEHSLFHSSDSKAEVALSLLNGLSNGVKKSVSEAKWLDGTALQIVGTQNEKVENAIHGLKLCLMFAGKVAAQMVSNVVGGGDISNVKLENGEKEKKDSPIPQLADYVHDLRSGLTDMVGKITCNKRPVKAVFFIDDLDRVPPPTAVEILDITKNIFDIPNCVFVLAIDYDVIVKGLEEKFGEKTEKNEREFRQYFDKIIQIPFTMPVGAYSKNLANMLVPALRRLGNEVNDADNDLMEKLAEDARLATGGIPRSIKRIINTLSLLQHIANAKSKKAGERQRAGLPKDIEARFIIVALHINFPEICRRLMEKPDFPKWDIQTLSLPWKLDYKGCKDELDMLAKDNLFDDPWEKVVYCLCAQSPWLKSQARNVSALMNHLLSALDDGAENPKEITEDGLGTLKEILEGIRVVSIDSETAGVAQEFDNSSVKTDQVTCFCQALQNELSRALPAGVMEAYESGYAKRGEGGKREFWIDTDGDDGSISYFYIIWEKNEKTLYFGFYATRHGVTQKKAKETVEKLCGENYYDFDGGDVDVFIYEEGFTFDDFQSKSPQSFVPRIKELYELTDKVQKALAKLK